MQSDLNFEKGDLLKQIIASPLGSVRDSLADKLEKLISKNDFYHIWLLINSTFRDLELCWTYDGFDPTRSKLPRDILLLRAADFGSSIIDNAGFWEFFREDIGVIAPEMLEWFERAGLSDKAEMMRWAMALYGQIYPRDFKARNQILSKLEGSFPGEIDVFAPLERNGFSIHCNRFDDAANIWIRDVCNVTRLSKYFA